MSLGWDLPSAYMEWMEQGKCRKEYADPHIFHPDKANKAAQKEGKDFCNGLSGTGLPCPVKEQCLRHAIENDEHGIWGGTSRKERKLQATLHRKKFLELQRRLKEQLQDENVHPISSSNPDPELPSSRSA